MPPARPAFVSDRLAGRRIAPLVGVDQICSRCSSRQLSALVSHVGSCDAPGMPLPLRPGGAARRAWVEDLARGPGRVRG